MNAEAALMGVPTISAFQGSLYTDAYLERRGLLRKVNNPGLLVKQARISLENEFRDRFRRKAKRLLDSMEDPLGPVSNLIGKTVGQS